MKQTFRKLHLIVYHCIYQCFWTAGPRPRTGPWHQLYRAARGSPRIIIFNLRTAAFKAYCAICVRRSNFRHQASPRVSPRESTQRRKLEVWPRNVRQFCLNADLHVTFRVLLRKSTTWDRRLYFPSEGKRAEEFFALKIRRLRPGANPRTCLPKASTLPLDHRSRSSWNLTF